MRVLKVYNTKKGKLRAKIHVAGQSMVVYISEKKSSFISANHGTYLIRGIDLDRQSVSYQFLYEYSNESLQNTPVATIFANN